MPPALVPFVVELLTTLLFVGVLIYLRASLTRRGLTFWILLWVARGAVSLTAMRFVAGTDRLVVMFYTPLQIAFSMILVVIAIRLENQKEQLRNLNDELNRLRSEANDKKDYDALTGLRDRAALARWMDQENEFDGLVVVCDMDDFKQINDSYGHLVGDEILHGVGKLIGNSIRDEDMAFRWGGDEFVIFFQTHDAELVNARLHHIQDRLSRFQLRHHGTLPVHFSWGIAPTAGRPLRQSMEEADRLMYELKRTRRIPQLPGQSNKN